MSFNSILISRPNASKARLPSLYADFRPLKHNNPEGYLANIHVWQSALSHALSQNTFQNDSILVLDITSQFLSDISFPPYGRPLGIASVVEESLRDRDWIPLADFLSESVSIYERSWSVTGVIGWMWRKLVEYSAGDDDKLPSGRYVLRKNLEDVANKVLKHANEISSGYVSQIYSPETFAKTFSKLFTSPLSKLDQLILLKYLSRDKKEIVCSPTCIKFKVKNRLTPVTSSDEAISQLNSVHLSLTSQITLLESQIASLTQKAKDATSTKSRFIALSALKSRKLASSALEKRLEAQSRIEEVLHGVEQAASDAEIVETLESGASALERLNRDIGGIERVERVMERVREGVEESEEVGRVIAEMGVQAGAVNEDEVKEEFEEMLRAEERERAKKEEIKRLEREIAKREAEEKEKAEKAKVEAAQQRDKTSEEASSKAAEAEKREDGLVKDLENIRITPEETATQERPVEDAIPN